MENSVDLGLHQVVFKEGDSAQKLYLIKRGTVLCLKASKDRLIPVFKAEAGDLIGENAMTPNGVYGYSTITLTTAELIHVPATNFSEIFKESPDWLVDLTTTMIGRYEKTAALIAENRVIHDSILSENDFPSSLEVEFKRLLS